MLVSILCAVVQEALFNLFAGQTKLHLLMIFCLTEILMSLARLLAYKICTIFLVSIHQESQKSKLLLIQYLCSISSAIHIFMDKCYAKTFTQHYLFTDVNNPNIRGNLTYTKGTMQR